MNKSAEEYCAKIYEWLELFKSSHTDGEYQEHFRTVELAVRKSCLLDRMLYGEEHPSKTPCPVHKGRWSGCHFHWPGQKWSDGSQMEVSPMLQEWYDAGCRCFMHSCGCTTGWNPDENCGCLEKQKRALDK